MSLSTILALTSAASHPQQEVNSTSRCRSYAIHTLFGVFYLYTILQSARAYVKTGSSNEAIGFAVYVIPLACAHFLTSRYGNIARVTEIYENTAQQFMANENTVTKALSSQEKIASDLKIASQAMLTKAAQNQEAQSQITEIVALLDQIEAVLSEQNEEEEKI
jgi:hypothetical protein